MNRQQRRNLDKKGFDGNKIAAVLDTYKIISDAEDDWIKEGEKVRLNITQMKSRKEWERLTERYRIFVLNNVNTIFTVKFIPKNGSMPSTVTFEEDDTWSFWEGDLIRLKNVNDEK